MANRTMPLFHDVDPNSQASQLLADDLQSALQTSPWLWLAKAKSPLRLVVAMNATTMTEWRIDPASSTLSLFTFFCENLTYVGNSS